MKIADETLDALFDMELPLPRPVVRSLAEGIDTILQKCALCLGSVRRQPHASDGCMWRLDRLCFPHMRRHQHLHQFSTSRLRPFSPL